jgi:hypothetical protein
VESGVLQDVDAVSRLLPPPSQQEGALRWLEEGRTGVLGAERVRETFRRALTDAGLRATAFDEGLDLYERAVSRDEPLGIGDFERSAQARRLLGRYLRQTDDGWRSVVYLYPPGRITSAQAA